MKPILFISLFILCFITSSLKTLAQPDTLSFLHISDLHLIFKPDGYQQDLVNSRIQYGHGIEPLKQFLKTMPQKTNSKFVIATGDLVDFCEGKAVDGEMLKIQVPHFLKLMKNSPIPVFLTLGNHDITAYRWDNSIKNASQDIAGRARASWIRNSGCFSDGTYYSKVFVVDGTSYRLIFLDDSYNRFSLNENITIPYIEKSQLHWLKNQINQSPDDVEIIFMHLPLAGAPAKGSSCELYDLLIKSPSVKLILAGHNHKNEIYGFVTAGDKKLIQVKTGAFGQSTENWRQVRLTKDQILVSFPGKMENEVAFPSK